VPIDTHNLTSGRHTIFIESQDAAGNYGVPSAVFIDIVAEEYQARIDPSVRSSSSSRATTLAYDFLVTNKGTQDDSFDLQIMGNIWLTTLSQQSVGPLIPGESTPVAVKVYIPDSAEVGEQDMVIILVTSKADPSQFSQATITTTSRIPMLFIPHMAK
jgi:carboxypeptidase T